MPEVRVLRTLVLAGTSVGAGVVAHRHAGGQLPHPVALLVVLAVLALPVARLSRRRVPGWVAGSVLLLGQLAVHLVGAATHAHGALQGAQRHATAASGRAHAQHVDVATTAGGGTSLAMVLGHVTVAVVLSLLWTRGEEALFAIAARLAPPAVPTWAPAPRTRVHPHLEAPVPVVRHRLLPSRAPPLPVS